MPDSTPPANPSIEAAPQTMPIAVCLSGGGFRATLFHIGLLLALRRLNLMARVRCIVGVSGGAVAAAHVMSWWDTYANPDSDLKKPLDALKTLCGRGVQERVIQQLALQWPLFTSFKSVIRWCKQKLKPDSGERRGRMTLPISTRLLMRQLRACLQKEHRNATLSEVSGNKGPELYLLSSDVKNMRIYALGSKYLTTLGLGLDADTPPRRHEVPICADFALAASSAFPGAIQPIRLRSYGAHLNISEISKEGPELLDGGVLDNLGTRSITQLAPDCELVLSSCAENAFRTDAPMSDAGPLGNRFASLGRVFELSSRRDADNSMNSVVTVRLASSGTHAATVTWQEGLCNRLADTRTSFDAFAAIECDALINMGYYSAMRDIRAFCNTHTQHPFSMAISSLIDGCTGTPIQADKDVGASGPSTIDQLVSGRGIARRFTTYPMAWIAALIAVVAIAATSIAGQGACLLAWSVRSQSIAEVERDAIFAMSQSDPHNYTVKAADQRPGVIEGHISLSFFGESNKTAGGMGTIRVLKSSKDRDIMAEQNVVVFGRIQKTATALVCDGVSSKDGKTNHGYWGSSLESITLEGLEDILKNAAHIAAPIDAAAKDPAPSEPTVPQAPFYGALADNADVDRYTTAVNKLADESSERLFLVISLGTNMAPDTQVVGLTEMFGLEWLFPWVARIRECKQMLGVFVEVSPETAPPPKREFIGVLVRSNVIDNWSFIRLTEQ